MASSAGRFSKEGLDEQAFKNADGQLRLLVHCSGCPPFICVIGGTKTVGQLQEEICRQHSELFSGGLGDVPAVKIRWLEDSQRHALAASSCCSAVLADREKIYACSMLDSRESAFEQPGKTGSALELVSHWRNTCIDTAARLSALSQQDGREEEVFLSGGLQVLLSVAIHSGNLMPGDVAIKNIHAGLRSLLIYEDAARRIMESACEGQVIALLQCPDSDLAGLAAFMCSRLATDQDSHAALISWGAHARLAKAVQLSGSAAVRGDAMTTLRLMADNRDCHAGLLSPSVVKVILRSAADKSDAPLRIKALKTISAIASTGSQTSVDALKRCNAEEVLMSAAEADENDVRRAAVTALALLRPGEALHAALPALDPAAGGLSDMRPAHTPQPWQPRNSAAHKSFSDSSNPATATRDLSSLSEEGHSMAIQGRGMEYLAAGGIDKLSLLASSSAPLLASVAGRPDSESGSGQAGGAHTGASAAANILLLLCKSDTATRASLAAGGAIALLLSLARSSEHPTQVASASALAQLCNSQALHAILLQHSTLACLFALVFSKHEGARVQGAKALSHLAHDRNARTQMLAHQPLLKLLASQPAGNTDDAFWAYLSLLPRK